MKTTIHTSLATPVTAREVALLPEAYAKDPAVIAAMEHNGCFSKPTDYLSPSIRERETLAALREDGSLQRAIEAGFMVETDTHVSLVPAVGMGATIDGYSDSEAYEVVAVSKSGRQVLLRPLRVEKAEWAHPMDYIPGGFAGHVTNQGDQRWTYSSSELPTVMVSLRKDGTYREKGKSSRPVKFGFARHFWDFNF